jgi:hypothetical protein
MYTIVNMNGIVEISCCIPPRTGCLKKIFFVYIAVMSRPEIQNSYNDEQIIQLNDETGRLIGHHLARVNVPAGTLKILLIGCDQMDMSLDVITNSGTYLHTGTSTSNSIFAQEVYNQLTTNRAPQFSNASTTITFKFPTILDYALIIGRPFNVKSNSSIIFYGRDDVIITVHEFLYPVVEGTKEIVIDISRSEPGKGLLHVSIVQKPPYTIPVEEPQYTWSTFGSRNYNKITFTMPTKVPMLLWASKIQRPRSFVKANANTRSE